MSKNSSRVPAAALLTLALLAGGCDRQDSAAGQAKATAKTQSTDTTTTTTTTEKVVIDKIGILDRSHKGEAAPTARFTMPDGSATSLAAFAGKPVLLNLWATWCGPCVAEMPTLDRVALDDAGLQVVTVSQDLQGASSVQPYFAKGGLKAIKPYLDPTNAMLTALQTSGAEISLPTSILYDSTGHEVWRMVGGMDWTTPTAKGLLAEGR